MMSQLPQSLSLRRSLIALVLGMVMTAIFVADTMTEYAVAAAVFYTAVILMAVRWFTPRTVVVLTVLCIVLTVVSFVLTPTGMYRVGLVNSGISILAIAITAYLGLKMVAAQAAAHAAQTRLLHIARTTSLGELTASIAHEVNQPLAAIVTSSQAGQRWLGQQPPQLEKANQALLRIQADAERASNVITRIRGLAGGEAPQRQRFVLEDAVREMAQLSQGVLEKRGIGLRWEFAPNLPEAWADRIQIQQVVGNLLLNAIEAITAEHRQAEITITARRLDEQQLQLTVTDCGSGLSPAVQAHLFDAFWTTKSDGMGLGLTISRNMIEAHGGRIWAEPRDDGLPGTQFHISLPATTGSRP
ncbi:ATP-binding protein [Comamonas testosteroni]|uniref:histidine kinase n=1 Tax=Comamonas testosteroni (strain DSM 14576 / KF-1) TaxID=399795 RepID=B7WTW9_COMTK|nr:ATP-binding protein [Comamonas testosteroni]EED69240.1 histidine kinase [Comamonas testosteroni KF-1]WQG67223.1 ATP-binding protein [Comamonas testosteroni]